MRNLDVMGFMQETLNSFLELSGAAQCLSPGGDSKLPREHLVAYVNSLCESIDNSCAFDGTPSSGVLDIFTEFPVERKAEVKMSELTSKDRDQVQQTKGNTTTSTTNSAPRFVPRQHAHMTLCHPQNNYTCGDCTQTTVAKSFVHSTDDSSTNQHATTWRPKHYDSPNSCHTS